MSRLGNIERRLKALEDEVRRNKPLSTVNDRVNRTTRGTSRVPKAGAQAASTKLQARWA